MPDLGPPTLLSRAAAGSPAPPDAQAGSQLPIPALQALTRRDSSRSWSRGLLPAIRAGLPRSPPLPLCSVALWHWGASLPHQLLGDPHPALRQSWVQILICDFSMSCPPLLCGQRDGPRPRRRLRFTVLVTCPWCPASWGSCPHPAPRLGLGPQPSQASSSHLPADPAKWARIRASRPGLPPGSLPGLSLVPSERAHLLLCVSVSSSGTARRSQDTGKEGKHEGWKEALTPVSGS